MEIMVGYGIVPQMERILQYYWKNLYMVERSGRYYGTLLKGHQSVTQGSPLLTTIFNLVLYAVICHRVTLVAGEEAGPDDFGWAIQWPKALFYADNGILASPFPGRPARRRHCMF